MEMRDPFQHATLGVGVFYKEPSIALDWLEKAFGFERSMLVKDRAGKLVHSEMRFEDAYLVVDSEWSANIASPVSINGKNTQSVYIKIRRDIDGHCTRARTAGAVIVQEPQDQFYGERTYRAVDFEGHVWTFAQTIKAVSKEEAERLSGLVIDGWHRPEPSR
jgi:uncharacterized glyoxalase superfamily protein PhnB